MLLNCGRPKGRMNNDIRIGIVAVLLIGLSACAKDGKIDPLAGGGGLAGTWLSSDNVFTAEFVDGSFVSKANDTGEVLSEGSYVVSSVSEIKLSWRGRLSGQDNSANCSRPEANRLTCVDAAGRAFTLNKTS
jgi:hypothetical protein